MQSTNEIPIIVSFVYYRLSMPRSSRWFLPFSFPELRTRYIHTVM